MNVRYMTEENKIENKKFEDILVEIKENYAVISLNRPDKLNALRNTTNLEVAEALEEIDQDPKIRCVVIRGTKNYTKKPAFSAGADLTGSGNPSKLRRDLPYHNDIGATKIHSYHHRIMDFSKPLIAAVDGYALGGGVELTLLCDLVFASKRSVFGFPEVKRAITPAMGGTIKMAQHIGLNRARFMIFTGRHFSAQTMENWGYVAQVFEDDKFEEEIHKIASEIANGPTTTFYAIKKCMTFGTQVPLQIGGVLESMSSAINSTSNDIREGIMAFRERREPNFKGT